MPDDGYIRDGVEGTVFSTQCRLGILLVLMYPFTHRYRVSGSGLL